MVLCLCISTVGIVRILFEENDPRTRRDHWIIFVHLLLPPLLSADGEVFVGAAGVIGRIGDKGGLDRQSIHYLARPQASAMEGEGGSL